MSANTPPLPFVRSVMRGSKKKRKPKNLRKALEVLQKQIVIKLYGTDCYTCSQKALEGSNCQLGHVPWPRSMLSTVCKFDYRYTRIQCYNCNINRGGMGAEAYKRMVKDGIDPEILFVYNTQTKGVVCKPVWFEYKISEYSTFLTGDKSVVNSHEERMM